MRIQDLIIQAVQFLKPSSSSPRLDAEIIIADILKCRREDLYIRFKEDLEGKILQQCLMNIERRIQGEPVSYITNKKDFLNHTFFVQPGVLIPRPETELLVEYVLHWIEEKGLKENIWVLDLGCGSGCIGISLLKEVFKMNVVAVDIADAAIETTKKNAEELNVTNKIFILQKSADDLDYKDFKHLAGNGFTGQFDVVISNPPYIGENDPEVEVGVKAFEPQEALFCENNGYEKIEKWTNVAGSLLREHGLWIFETGYSQGPSSKKIVEDSGFFENAQVVPDYAGLDRFIIATKKNINSSN